MHCHQLTFLIFAPSERFPQGLLKADLILWLYLREITFSLIILMRMPLPISFLSHSLYCKDQMR